MKRDKPRLQLMPEVLPDPTRNPGVGNARERTLAHMNRLLALAASGAAIAACNNNPSPGAAAGQHEARAPTDRPTDTAVEFRDREPGRPPGGYAVVDPIPPPVHHARLARTIRASATWKAKSKGTLTLRLGPPTLVGASYATDVQPVVMEGNLVRAAVRPHSLECEIAWGQAESITVQVPVNCARCGQWLLAVVKRTEDGALHVDLSDAW